MIIMTIITIIKTVIILLNIIRTIIIIKNSKSCPEVLKIGSWYSSDYVVLMLRAGGKETHKPHNI